jgi:hypothetical protein
MEALVIDWRDFLMFRLMRGLRRLRLNPQLLVRGSAHAFTDYFKGFEKVEAVQRIFGEKTDEVLRSLKVEFTWIGGYMWVNAANGHLTVSSQYLKHGDKIDIYLDVIHELVHIRQFMEGKQLFDENYDYVERPTEVEAYRVAVEEAIALGLSEERICEYLKTEWMNDEDFGKLAKALKVNCSVTQK